MKDFIVLMGISASGKTTWAKEWVAEDPQNRIRICPSELEGSLGFAGPDSSTFTGKVSYDVLSRSFEAGLNIVIDDINLERGQLELLSQLADRLGNGQYKVSSKVFYTSVDECIARDKLRNNPKGEKEIRRIFRQYKDRLTLLQNAEIVTREVKVDPLLPDCIIVDIDGTLCLNVTGRPFYNAGNSVLQDRPVIPVCKVIRSFISTDVCEVIFITGRDNSMAKATEEYIEQHLGIVNPKIFYRDAKDFRKSYQTKLEVYQKHILGKYNVVFVMEDNNSVVKMFREQGLTVLQPNASDY